ncbi:MAG: Gfo/Idh/MocA family oxidoreductase [Flavobacteriaceae bacterium]
MSEKIAWGILGLGGIAHKFVKDLALVKGAKLQAVASSSKERAIAFAQEYNASTAYGSYEALYADPVVEVIYIASVHVDHYPQALAALNAGKAVLCEKPMGINTQQLKAMIALAKAKKVFLMEAFWSRFNPALLEAKRQIQQGRIGDLRHLQASFAMPRWKDKPDGRLLNLAKGGGSLLDIGVYPVFLAYFLLGKPKEIIAKANFNPQGTEIQSCIIFTYLNAQAQLYSSLTHPFTMEAKVYGEKGELTIIPTWHESEALSWKIADSVKLEKYPKKGKGYVHEIEEVHHCLLNKKQESENWSLQDSFNLIELMDEIRQQVGVIFPQELE